MNWLKENPYPTFAPGGVRAYKSKIESMKASNRYDFNFGPEMHVKWRNHTKWLYDLGAKVQEGMLFFVENNTMKKYLGKAAEIEIGVEEFTTLYYDKFYKNQVVEYKYCFCFR
jgi:hypothetical protein